MKQNFILFICISQYLLIKSDINLWSSIDVRFNCSYYSIKTATYQSVSVNTRMVPYRNISNFYMFLVQEDDNDKLIVENIRCFQYIYANRKCDALFKSSYIYFKNEIFSDDKILKFANPSIELSFQKFLYDYFSKSINPKDFNFVCTLLNQNTNYFHKLSKHRHDPLSNTSYFGIIFLATCIILVFVLCFGWFIIIYYQRYRQYRMKKQLRQALAKSAQQILDKSPVIIFDSNNRDIDQTDNEPMCAICLEIFKAQEKIRKLICKHYFHLNCIDPWLLSHQSCPLCNRNILRNSIPSISSNIMAAINERNNDLSTTIATNGNNQTNRL